MWVSHYGFEPMMKAVLPYVVRVEDTKVWELPFCLLLCDVLQTHRSSVSCYTQGFLSAAGPRARLSGSALSDADTNNNVTLLRFVAHGPGSFNSRRVFNSVDCGLSSPFYCKLPKILFELILVSPIPGLRQVLVHAHRIFRPQPNLVKL